MTQRCRSNQVSLLSKLWLIINSLEHLTIFIMHFHSFYSCCVVIFSSLKFSFHFNTNFILFFLIHFKAIQDQQQLIHDTGREFHNNRTEVIFFMEQFFPCSLKSSLYEEPDPFTADLFTLIIHLPGRPDRTGGEAKGTD